MRCTINHIPHIALHESCESPYINSTVCNPEFRSRDIIHNMSINKLILSPFAPEYLNSSRTEKPTSSPPLSIKILSLKDGKVIIT